MDHDSDKALSRGSLWDDRDRIRVGELESSGYCFR